MGELFHKHFFIKALFLFSFPYLKSESKRSFTVLRVSLFNMSFLTQKQYQTGQAQPRAQKIRDLGVLVSSVNMRPGRVFVVFLLQREVKKRTEKETANVDQDR